MTSIADDVTDLRRAILALDAAEAAASRAGHALAEAEELAEKTGGAPDVEELRAAWEAAEAAADKARERRRETEAGTELAEAVRVYACLYGGRRRTG